MCGTRGESRQVQGGRPGAEPRVPKAEGRGQDWVRETAIRQGGQGTPVRNPTQLCWPWALGRLTGGGDVPVTTPRLGDPKVWEGTSGAPTHGNVGI